MTDEFNPSPRLGDRLEAVIKEVRKWNRATSKELKFAIARLNLSERVRLEDEVALRDSVRGSVKAPNFDLQKVSFAFARHGIFLERGVGKGRKAGSVKARQFAKSWLKEPLETSIEELADLLSEYYADVAADDIKIIIPGVINTKIKVNG